MPVGNLATQGPSFLICVMGIAREPSPFFRGEGWHASFAFCAATTFLSSTDKFEWQVEANWALGVLDHRLWQWGEHMSTKKKKKHNLKVDNFVSSEDITEDYSLGKQPLTSSKGLYQRGKWGARIHRSFCWKKQTNEHVAKHQKVAAITKVKISR